MNSNLLTLFLIVNNTDSTYYSISSIDSLRCRCKKPKKITPGYVAPTTKKDGVEININNNPSQLNGGKSNDTLTCECKASSTDRKGDNPQHRTIESGYFFIAPLLLYFIITSLQLKFLRQKTKEDIHQNPLLNQAERNARTYKIKNSKAVFHIIINFLIGIICFLLGYYLYSQIDINCILISLLACLLVFFGLLYRFFKNY